MSKLTFDAFDDELEYVDPSQRRERPPKLNRVHKPKKDKWAVRFSVTEKPVEGQIGHELTLSPGLNATSEEKGYLVEQLTPFFSAKIITSVLQRVKGGKEANVYCCAAHPKTGLDLIAAKVYRPRQFRNLKNDSQYRQGRPMLAGDGSVISQRDWRAQKAIAAKSAFGLLAIQTSWVEYEYQTMKRLHEAGVAVPEPYQNSEHALLMEYLGDVVNAAPTLHLITLEQSEAYSLFEGLIRDVETMLMQGVVHGDLSAYNVMYWEGEIKIIDFPQMVDPESNPDARTLFGRDVERLCQYFARFGVRREPRQLARTIWQNYVQSRQPRPEAEKEPL
jgi:RIO kinase 1